jgi:uncharacterized membrane protein YeaQ/YmgE (transglycosylase-associated protein family)
MTLADVTINLTLNNLTIMVIAGALSGVITGQLLKSRGLYILGDVFFSLFGMLLSVVVLSTLLDIVRVGFVGYLLLAIMGAMVTVVLAHFALLVRRHAMAS